MNKSIFLSVNSVLPEVDVLHGGICFCGMSDF